MVMGLKPERGVYLRVIGLNDARVDVAMMRTPDDHNRLELMKFQQPTAVDAGQKNAPAFGSTSHHVCC
jgi:hypothetical protein